MLLVAACAIVLLPSEGVGATVRSPSDQSADVEGAADFRTAPTVADGVFSDTPLTGEGAWYAVFITNGAELHVVAAPVADRPDVEIEIELIGPTLTTLSTKREVLHVTRLRYGDDDSASRWFLRLTPRNEGRRGEPIPIRFTIEGSSEPDSITCDPSAGCTLHAEIADLETTIAQLAAELETSNAPSSSPEEQPTPIPIPAPNADIVNELREEVARLEGERERMRADGATPPGRPAIPSTTRPSGTLAVGAGLAGLVTGVGAVVARRRGLARTPSAFGPGASEDHTGEGSPTAAQPLPPPEAWPPTTERPSSKPE